MEISDKLVYIVGPVIAAVALYIRYRWRKQDQRQKEQEKKLKRVSGVDWLYHIIFVSKSYRKIWNKITKQERQILWRYKLKFSIETQYTNRVRGPTAGVPSLLTIHIIILVLLKRVSHQQSNKNQWTTNLFSYLKLLKCVNCRQNRTQQIM